MIEEEMAVQSPPFSAPGTSRPEFRTKAQMVFEALRQRIASGLLEPGTRLLLRSVAEEFECSEIPVREAFRSLAAVGMVDLVPHGGAHVSVLRTEDLVELTEIRALLEPEATVTALPHLGAAALAQLERLAKEMEAAAARLDGVAFGRLNRLFHGLIVDHCPNRKLAALINDVWERAERGRAVFRDDAFHLEESVRQHRALLAAIRARAMDDLRRRAEDHSRFGLEAVRRLAESYAASARPLAEERS
jgi:DNA-binding GntR family transcriptional regulator